MVIALEGGLEKLAGELSSRGYTIVNYPEYLGVVDAFIYTDQMPSTMGSSDDNMTNLSLENHLGGKAKGVLIINSRNKSLAQIEEVLRTRVYSPLF